MVALVCGSGLATLAAPSLGFDVSDYFPNGIGGWIGKVLYGTLLKDSMGEFGAGLLLGTLYVASVVFILTVDIGAEFAKICNKPLHVFDQEQNGWFTWTGSDWQARTGDDLPVITHVHFTGTGTRMLTPAAAQAWAMMPGSTALPMTHSDLWSSQASTFGLPV